MPIPRNRIIGLVLTCLFLGSLGGILFQKFYGAGRLVAPVLKAMEERRIEAYSDTTNRVRIPLATLKSRKRVMVALALGQSHAANYGETPKTSKRDVYNYYRGNLYLAQDPMLGADHDGGSVWTRLGDLLIERKQYDAVVFVPVAIGGTEIARWQPTGNLHQSILDAIDSLHQKGLAITHLLWHQGENDNLLKTNKASYKSMFSDMLASMREHGVDAPIYISIATMCGKHGPYPAIQEAQTELIDLSAGIYPGPNTDTLGLAYRYDGCHFTDKGLELEAELWVNSLERVESGASISPHATVSP